MDGITNDIQILGLLSKSFEIDKAPENQCLDFLHSINILHIVDKSLGYNTCFIILMKTYIIKGLL